MENVKAEVPVKLVKFFFSRNQPKLIKPIDPDPIITIEKDISEAATQNSEKTE